MTSPSFKELGLIEPLLKALSQEKYETPTPIQAEAIPPLLEGRDLIGSAKTGTGKTAAFALPLLQKFSASKGTGETNSPRALILTPTRELANQISENIKSYGRFLRVSHTVIYGGVGFGNQIRALSRKVDIVVATPGRLLDLFRQGHVFLDRIETLVLDEADRMLDMGFIHDIKKIISEIPEKRQTLFFSATMPENAKKLTEELLRDPVRVKVDPVSSTAEKINQKVLFVNQGDKEALLLSLFEDASIDRALVFTRTKHRANKIAQKLNNNSVNAEAIHGNKSQSARMQALRKFSAGKARVLVATDVASRGIDVKGVTHVINFEMPDEAECYVHRIGRTARAGAEGTAISFCDGNERSTLRAIERVIKSAITIDEKHPYHSIIAASSRTEPGKRKFFSKPRGNFNPRRPSSSGRRFGRAAR